MLPVAAAQLAPEQVPSFDERTQAVAACLPVPQGIAAIIGKYAMERFDGEVFGPEQWKTCWGATPVTLQGEEENPEPPEKLYEYLNSRVRPQDKLLAGFICAVTYIPQFVKKHDAILAVTARTLALEFGPQPAHGEAADLYDSNRAFNVILTAEEADRTEASCYFMMERDVAPDTKNKKPTVIIAAIAEQGDKGWQLPEPRNFFATVFSRRVWKGLFLYGQEPWTYTYGQGKNRAGDFFAFGGFDTNGLLVCDDNDCGCNVCGGCGSRKFQPLALGH